MSRLLIRFAAPALILALAGCTAHRSYREAQTAEKFGDWDRAVILYLELLEQRPDNVAYRSGLLRAKIRASQGHFEKAKKYREAGAREQALTEFRQAVQLDPTNQYAQVEFEKLRAEMAARRAEDSTPSSLQELKERTHGARPQPPVLSPRSAEPISLDFPKPVSVFDIYKALGKAFGINILFDPKLRPQEIAIELRDVVAQDALEILMRTANHFYKVLDAHTIIVVEDNPQNRRNYEDLVIQTFFLSNAEPKDVMTMLRSLVGAKNIAANDQLNAIVLRDTADKVKVAERIILTNDKSRGEVVIDVELLQINTSRLQELGISLSEYRVTQVLEPDPIPFSDLEFINQANWMLNLPSLIYDFIKNSSEAQLLASPQIRISDGEQATLHIGDRVPIPVTTFNTGQTIGGNIVPITSFQYQDIGIRLDLTPRIHHNQQVSLELSVEVSNLSGFVEGQGGQQQPIIGTRTIESTIRLQDGETNFLAGLIRTDETNTESGMPGLSEVPVLGRLFSKKTTNKGRTDLVLTLTPHVVRTPDITEEDLLPIWVGTEANITFRGGSPRVESEVEGPFDEDEESGAERIREMIRRRIQNLPRGLRGAAGEEDEEEAEEQPGVELVPAAPPTDPFRRERPEDEEEPPGDASLELPEEDEEAIFSAAALEPVFAQPVVSLAALDSPAAAQEKLPAPRAPLPAAEPVSARAAATLALQPRGSEVMVGATLELDLVAETTVAVSHFPITLGFDPAILEVTAVDAGDFLGPPAQVEVLSDRSTPGRLVLGASRLGRSEGATGTGLVARISLRALAPGSTRVRFEKGKALGPGLGAVEPIATRAARVRVTAEASGPPEAPEEPQPGAVDEPAAPLPQPEKRDGKRPEGA